MKAFWAKLALWFLNLWDKTVAFFGRFSRRTYSTLAVILIALVLVVDVGYHFVKDFSSDLETMPVKTGSFTETVEGDLYLIRDEKSIVYGGGRVLYYVQDGEKVSVGKPLAAVYPETVSADHFDALSAHLEVRTLLESVSNSRPEKVSETLKTRIAGVMLTIENAMREGNVEKANRQQKTLAALTLCREELVGAYELSSVMKTLDGEIAALEALMGEPQRVILAEESGWFSRSTDGYEGFAKASSVEEMNYAEFSALFEDKTPSGELTVGKMLTSHRFYAVTFVDAETARAFSVNRKYELSVDGETLSLTLGKVLYQNEREGAALLFEGSSLTGSLSVRRISQVILPTATHEGFKLPVAALTEKDGVYGVYILRGFVVEFREVSIAFREGNTMVLKNAPENSSGKFKLLAENDNVIIRGEDLYDGKIVH